MKTIYKCIKPILPRASTYIFSRNFQEDTEELLFEDTVIKDGGWKDSSGYISFFNGDSGSPFWKTDASNRAILISIVSSKVGPKFEPITISYEIPELQCRNKTSKVTEDVVLWVKQHAGIPIKQS